MKSSFLMTGLVLFAFFWTSAGGIGSGIKVSADEHVKGAYYCPMHTDYTADKPGSCPICGMDLVKRKDAVDVETSSPGVSISAHRQQLIGVRTAVVGKKRLVVELRVPGRVVFDQELYDAQTAYLKSGLIRSTYWNPQRQKLLLLGMSDVEIDQLRRLGWPDAGLIALGSSEGKKVAFTPGKTWVYASVFEGDSSIVKPGDKVSLEVKAFPDEVFQGEVSGVARMVDPVTRTVRVRIRVDDPSARLNPEMFAIARIQAFVGERLSVPSEAVMDTGVRKVVYVVKAETSFEPRNVVTGVRAGDDVEIIKGLMAGETVVISGNFLIDSESRMKGAL